MIFGLARGGEYVEWSVDTARCSDEVTTLAVFVDGISTRGGVYAANEQVVDYTIHRATGEHSDRESAFNASLAGLPITGTTIASSVSDEGGVTRYFAPPYDLGFEIFVDNELHEAVFERTLVWNWGGGRLWPEAVHPPARAQPLGVDLSAAVNAYEVEAMMHVDSTVYGELLELVSRTRVFAEYLACTERPIVTSYVYDSEYSVMDATVPYGGVVFVRGRGVE